MLAKALKQHHPTPSISGNVISQQQRGSTAPLKPTQSSLLNTRLPGSAASKSLKRTASQISGEDSPRSSQNNMVKIPGSSHQARASLNRLDSLNVNVEFDENDFEDDNDIDFNEEFPNAKEAEVPKTPSAFLPVPFPAKDSGLSKTPSSSLPLPWSSSPQTQADKPSPKAPLPALKPANSANSNKRRTLPWIDAENMLKARDLDDHGPRPPPNRTPAHVQAAIDRTREQKVADEKLGTPQTKAQSDSPYLWNKTASAVKEEQKKLRQGHKKLVKDGIANEDKKNQMRRKTRESVARVFLSDEQKQVLDIVVERKKSVFFTGSAGTGKSVLLRETIKVLRDKYKREPDRVAVTASTGLAACNVGGVTLHSFAGIGLGKEVVPELVKKIKRNQKAKQRWLRTKVLIVDEISMVDGDLFDKLEAIARAIRNNGRPFGGIQLIITGDFFQLPPVPDYGKVAKFCFDAGTWTTSIEHTIGLTQVFRQKDPVFANMLNEMRLGRLTNKSIESFRAMSRPLTIQDDFEATELFPTRNEVDYANNNRMKNLTGREFEFKAVDGGSIQDVTQREKLLSSCMAPQSIKLKKGAQVMLIKNIDETLVNGSVGKVIAFMDEKTFDIYHEDEDEFQAVETMDMNDEGMTRSRQKLKQMINKDLAGDTSSKWPLVRFAIADGTSRDLLCQQESWKIELPNGEVQASRSQIPLILAWALSIHKAQGQTLDRVKVDLGKIFEKGQAYVALSRATCQEGLQISRFDPKKVMAHERVRGFYDSLYAVGATLSRANSSTRSTATLGAKKYEENLDGRF